MLNRTIDQIIEDVRSVVSEQLRIGAPGVERLYHYTNAAGLFGICTSRTLWASHLWFMNDPRELSYALSIAGSESVSLDYNASIAIQAHSAFHPRQHCPSIYAVSLSELDDDLSSWRTYGDNGNGYAVHLFPNRFSSLGWNAAIVRVIYDQIKHTSLLKSIMAFAAEAIKVDTTGASDSIAEIAGWFDLAVSACKHPHYVSESEWRFVVTRPPAHGRSKFRLRNGRIVPYLELPLSESGTYVIDGVTCGSNVSEQEKFGAVIPLCQIPSRGNWPAFDVSKVSLR